MSISRRILPPRRIRILLYALVVAALFLFRGPRSWEGLRDVLLPPEDGGSLRVAGRELAPDLVDELLRAYRRDYPKARLQTTPLGGAYAMEQLLEERTDVALLPRAPRAKEVSAFTSTDGGPPVAEPIAVGALVLLVSAEAAVDSITWGSLRALVGGGTVGGIERLYAEDPDRGSWDGLPPALGVEPGNAILFLEDAEALEQALRDDPRGIGVRAEFAWPVGAPSGLKVLALSAPEGGSAARPTYEDVAHGRYALTTRLHVVCRASARGEASKLVTFASGARGQRSLERAGFLPAQRFLREILLDPGPLGAR